jgi:poly(A) polymerase
MQVNIDKLSDVLTHCPHFDLLRTLCKDLEAYIVGGAVRDALLGRPISDLDLITPIDPTSLAKTFARQINGHWFWLDEERRQSRVVVSKNDTPLYYDFARFRAPDLKRDLLDRDFSVNALALPLSGSLLIESLIDPCNGLQDFRQNRLRMISSTSFLSDPLRIIKGVRHATALRLQVDAETQEAMRFNVAGLKQVAPERIRKEFWMVLEDSQAARGLQLLGSSGVGEFLFGCAFTPTLPDLLATLDKCRDAWRRLVSENSGVADWLSPEIEQGLRTDTLLLMAFLLRQVSPDLPVALAKKWSLSRRAATSLSALSTINVNSVSALSAVAQNGRAYAWWANSCRVEPKLLLLAVAVAGLDGLGDIPPAIRAWIPIVNSLDNQRPVDLVDGHWLKHELEIKQGPEMTKALEMVRKAEIYGEVVGSDSAKEFLSRHYKNKH